MSSTVSGTNYNFSIEVQGNGLGIDGGFQLSTGSGSNDALALEILQALNGVSWPAGIHNPVSVTKATDTAVVYSPDLTTNPPAFT